MIDLSPEHLQVIKGILATQVPGARVLVFGSRVQGGAHKFSDLDIAVRAERKLSLSELGRLRECFADSDLPFRVDVLDWHGLDEGFRKIISERGEEWQV